jgi:hypothetical protein
MDRPLTAIVWERREPGYGVTPDAYDGVVTFVPPTIRATASEIAVALKIGREDEALRLAFQMVERYDRASAEDRRGMVADPPFPVGDERFDALIAAIAEFSCATHLQPIPAWTEHSTFFLEQWWFVSGMRSLHADAIAHSPISFARRGVFITENALSYA